MSGRHVRIKYSEKWGWWLAWGNETFYTDERVMQTWEAKDQAIDWLTENHPSLTIVDVADGPAHAEPTVGQLPLFKVQA